ncbi:DUF3486 family protein [Pseudomonas asplenii]|uniref:Terminase n=1 Tax=Pseudomonas asplenii TaxID=53407 RepID=A0A0M9GGR6_9PSED|nr:DUF3486 family protein [Pseudomonas fuscovaginae]KPA90617.1 Protein of unknown function (DUF3486) [Pseudomonas fuscovaginae]
MPPRSKVAGLPAAVKEWLDVSLVESNFSGYEALSAELENRGYSIGKSALHRYGSDFELRLAALKTSSAQAKAVVMAAPDDEGAVNEALMRLTQERLFNVLMDGEQKVDLTKMAKAISELGRASVMQKKWQTEVREKAEAAAARVEKIAKKGGLTQETVDQIRREILGMAA